MASGKKHLCTHADSSFPGGASCLLRAWFLQSSHCETVDSLSAEDQPGLLIFIHSIHTPVRAYKVQIFLIWKLLRFMTPLAIYSARREGRRNQLTLKKKEQIIIAQILSRIVTICSPSRAWGMLMRSFISRHGLLDEMCFSRDGIGAFHQKLLLKSKLVMWIEVSNVIKKQYLINFPSWEQTLIEQMMRMISWKGKNKRQSKV